MNRAMAVAAREEMVKRMLIRVCVFSMMGVNQEEGTGKCSKSVGLRD